MPTIGDRVADLLVRRNEKQGEVGERIGLTPDAMSKSIRDKRAFSSLELVQIADLLGTDFHWLVTGEPDPRRAIVFARHTHDSDSRSYENSGRSKDQALLDNIELAYRQAYEQAQDAPELPRTAADVREVLGDRFVEDFAERVQDRLGIDVVRVLGLSTAYAVTVCGRRIVVIPQDQDWYRANWSLAHELAHFVLGHREADATSSVERTANQFAAELLLPEDEMRTLRWDMDAGTLSEFVWAHGVSTQTLRFRLENLQLQVSANVNRLAQLSTQYLLSRHLPNGLRLSAKRRNQSSQRRFPAELQEIHLRKIESGFLAAGTYAWMLELSDKDRRDIEPPAPEPASAEELDEAFGG